jgi:hypothetical protein
MHPCVPNPRWSEAVLLPREVARLGRGDRAATAAAEAGAGAPRRPLWGARHARRRPPRRGGVGEGDRADAAALLEGGMERLPRRRRRSRSLGRRGVGGGGGGGGRVAVAGGGFVRSDRSALTGDGFAGGAVDGEAHGGYRWPNGPCRHGTSTT